jgi:hypothetical protein
MNLGCVRAVAASNLLLHVFVFTAEFGIFGAQLGSNFAIHLSQIKLIPPGISVNGGKRNVRVGEGLAHLFCRLLLSQQRSGMGRVESDSLRNEVFS